MSSLPHVAGYSTLLNKEEEVGGGALSEEEEESRGLLSMGDRTASYGGWSQTGAEHQGQNAEGAQPGPGWERELPGEVATSSQFRALFLKSFHVQRRSKK